MGQAQSNLSGLSLLSVDSEWGDMGGDMGQAQFPIASQTPIDGARLFRETSLPQEPRVASSPTLGLGTTPSFP